MVFVLRALLTVLPGIILIGGILMSNHREAESDPGSAVTRDIEVMQQVTGEDEERMHRIALKQETARDMLDGRLTVAEATARFLDVCAMDPECLEHLRSSLGSTDEEKALLQLLSFARGQASRDPERYAESFARAHQEGKSLVTAVFSH